MNLIMHIKMIFFDIHNILINREHINWLKSSFLTKSRRQKWEQDERHRTFITWFTERVRLFNLYKLDRCLSMNSFLFSHNFFLFLFMYMLDYV